MIGSKGRPGFRSGLPRCLPLALKEHVKKIIDLLWDALCYLALEVPALGALPGKNLLELRDVVALAQRFAASGGIRKNRLAQRVEMLCRCPRRLGPDGRGPLDSLRDVRGEHLLI